MRTTEFQLNVSKIMTYKLKSSDMQFKDQFICVFLTSHLHKFKIKFPPVRQSQRLKVHVLGFKAQMEKPETM